LQWKTEIRQQFTSCLRMDQIQLKATTSSFIKSKNTWDQILDKNTW